MHQEDKNNGVYQFLRGLGLERHWDIFKAKGYDRESDLTDLDEEDMDHMHIGGSDRGQIIQAVNEFSPSASFHLQCWLDEQGLGHYYDNLTCCDVTDLRQVEHLTLGPGLFDELEMDVPGHRKRFSRAVTQLRKKRRLGEPEDAVCVGHWGKPTPLVGAKNDFLCLTARLHSTRDAEKSATLEFMVDSGSDVVTIRQEILDELDLELMGTIQSRGVHASKQKQLYKAIINIGGVDVETEVMAETYESVGNQVLRNFRHYIDAHRHFWLQSDHRFLPPGDLIPPALQPPGTPEEGAAVVSSDLLDVSRSGDGDGHFSGRDAGLPPPPTLLGEGDDAGSDREAKERDIIKESPEQVPS